jgi:MerR family transcriptional regulator/heat shock protein HspR
MNPMAADQDLYLISMAARLLEMHPQTLRKYERLGLVRPSRTLGSMRLYSREELARLRLIKRLVDELGINLAGVQRLLSIADVVQRIRPLTADDALPKTETQRMLSQEIERLCDMLGI